MHGAIGPRVAVPGGDVVHRLLEVSVFQGLGALRIDGGATLSGTITLAGNAKVEAAIAGGTPSALIHASDASADGVEKLDRQYRAMCRDAGRTPYFCTQLTIEQMSLALGRANVVHAAVKPGGVAEHFIFEALRLARYRSGTDDPGTQDHKGSPTA